MAESDDSPISGPGPGEDALTGRTPILTAATPKDEIEDAVEVPVTDTPAAEASESVGTEPAVSSDEAAADTAKPEDGPADDAFEIDLVADEPAAAEESTASTAAVAAAAGAVAGAALASAAGGSGGASAGASGSTGPSGPAPSPAPAASSEKSSGGSAIGWVVTTCVAAVVGGVVAIAAQPYLEPYLGGVTVSPATLNALSARVTQLETGTLQINANTKAIAALQADLKALLAAPAAPAAPSAGLGELASRVEALTGQGDVLTRLAGELDAHSGELASVKTRLETLGTGIATASADITALKEQVSELVAADSSGAEKIAGIQAALVALDGRMTSVAGVAAGLQSRMEAVEGTKGGALGDRGLATAALALTTLAQDIQAGLPFSGALEALKPVLTQPVPANVAAAAATGLPTNAALRESFDALAEKLDIAVMRAEGGTSVLDRLIASARTMVIIRSTDPGEAAPSASPVAMIRTALAVGNLPQALTVAEALPPETAELVGDWTKQLKARVDAGAFLAATSRDFLARIPAGN